MRLLLSVPLALLLLLPGPVMAQTFQVATTVDSVTGVRRIASTDLRPLPTRSYAGSHAAFRAVHESTSDAETRWELVLFGYAPDTTDVSRATEVRLRTDSTQLVPNRIVSRSRAMQETLLEVKRLILTREQFERAARTDSLTITIGTARFDVSHVLRTDLRLILDRVSSSPPPRRASEAKPNNDTSSQSTDAEG